MPVHSAGPRLYRSIKFQHLGKVGGGSRASNIALNLTPFVDMMTILVTFLLMVFSASGEILRAHEGLNMPLAADKAALQRAPVIVVTQTEMKVLIENKHDNSWSTKDVGQVANLLENPPLGGQIDSLFEVLKSLYDDVHTNIEQANSKMFSKDELAACSREKEGLPPLVDKEGKVKTFCPDGLAVIQADESTDTRVITWVVNTARQAKFGKLLFAIKYTDRGPQ